MARRTGSADQAQRNVEQAQAAYLANAAARIRAGGIGTGSRSPDTMVGGAAAAGAVRAGGQGKPAPTLAEQLATVPPSFWADGQGQDKGGNQGGGGQTTEQAPPLIPPPADKMPTQPSNVDTMSKMYADALAELQRQYGVSQGNIDAAIARMEADPYNRANAYANLQIAAPRVAADPLAEYMAAAGLSGGQSAAAQQLSQAEADAYQQAARNMANILATSQEQANLSRLADIGLIRTGAQQDLEQNLNMLRLGLEKERIAGVSGLQQQNLQNQLNMRNNIASQISNIFSGQNVAPESILKLIEAALAKMNMNRWSTIPGMGA